MSYDDMDQSADLNGLKPTILAEGTEFTGQIKGQSNLILAGKLTGTVDVPTILIESTGQAEVELVTKDAKIKGVMQGQLNTESLFVGSMARVDGSISYSVIETQKGATLLGTFHKKSLNLTND